MRIAVLGAGGTRRTELAIVRAARTLGHECSLINVVGWSRYTGAVSSRIVRYLTDAFNPDFLILTRHAVDVGEATLRHLLRNRPSVYWYFDLEPREKVVSLGRLVSKMYVTYFGQLETYKSAGVAEVGFLPQGVDPDGDVPATDAPPRFHCDTSFVGSGQSSYRYEVLRAVAAVSQLQIRGPGWDGAPADLPVAGGPVYGRQLSQVVRGASISLGASSYPGQDRDRFSASNRMWKILGGGGVFFGRHVGGVVSFFPVGGHAG